MRLLLNENVPLASARALRQSGHDVVAISEVAPGSTDEAVLAMAHLKQRIIVTFDRDYGELVFRRRLPVPLGVVYLRFLPDSPEEPAEYLERLVVAGIDLHGRFTTGDRDQVRQRSLESLKR